MDSIKIFTDGACSGNPGKGGWGAIICFSEKEVEEIGGGEEESTNNRMELRAAHEALKIVEKRSLHRLPLELYTDSLYLIQGITKWIQNWQKNDWKGVQQNKIKNKDLWEKLLEQNNSMHIRWKHVEGHRGIAGNERCDKIAVYFSQGKKIRLYQGPFSSYPIDLSPAKKALAATGFSLPYYLSYVSQELKRHQSWEECSKRVKGVSAARYRKCKSPQEEEEIKKAWGVK